MSKRLKGFSWSVAKGVGLVALLGLLACAQDQSIDLSSFDNSLQGTVVLKIDCASSGSASCQESQRAAAHAKIIVSQVDGSGNVLASSTISADQTGAFAISLESGNYVLQVDPADVASLATMEYYQISSWQVSTPDTSVTVAP